ncbi:DNA-binding transcriptional regulator, LysR family [Lentzea waywayandensis]|uniref:DNA-binding transcriptional regulator, LysR family n=1 Tax=Lentzea waywayandensis TaxID=84724 RepID=A0A1I6FBN4_9PSEU|nr:LysR substrate-binding domain-containing protein [Lentzea waywayandensis]SFR27396.1 DNA-binding transcriptional regulator, LysR family [Lentzea waywayandensis]
MDLTAVPLVALRVFQEVAERGSLSAAAAALGYTQSAVSRQIAALERVVRAPLLDRQRDGVQLTDTGHVLLRHAGLVLAQLDAASRELSGLPATAGTVRLGWFTSAGGTLVPSALASLRRSHPALTVTTRDGTTASLVRALRARTVDIAVLASEPPFPPLDDETPALRTKVLDERELLLAVPSTHPLAHKDFIEVADLRGWAWIAGPPGFGVWPGLDERVTVAHVARDWLAKLQLVASGAGITTLPEPLAALVPSGVQVIRVRSRERQRIVVAWLNLSEPASVVLDALVLRA